MSLTTTTNQFALFSRPVDKIAEIMKANIGEGRISIANLDRVKVPTGGGNAWSVPGLNGDEMQKEIQGILIYWKQSRAFWRQEYTGKSQEPDCRSEDGVVGEGDPGGPCAPCPFSQWESDPKGGKGQACKANKQLFIIRPGTIMPMVLQIPATSITIFEKYMFRLASNMLSYYEVVTSLKLEKIDNGNVPAYSRVSFQYVDALSEDQCNAVEILRDQLIPVLRSTRREYVEDQNGGEDLEDLA